MTMPPETPLPLPSMEYSGRSLVDADNEHLKILSICWYVMSGMSALFGFLPSIYLILGIAILTGTIPMGAPGHVPADRMVGVVFIVMASVGILMLWTIALLAFLTGRSLARRKRLVLCYVTSAIACLQIPFGTLLGVFTFIVLARPTVRDQFHP
jgi:hypothetical protein